MIMRLLRQNPIRPITHQHDRLSSSPAVCDSIDTLLSCLDITHRAVIDINIGRSVEIPSPCPFMFMALSNHFAYHETISLKIIKSVAKHIYLTEDLQQKISTCLHEGILNAIIHGNLHLHDTYETMEEMERFHNEIDKRLLSSRYASSYVSIEVHHMPSELIFIIKDQGKGFDYISQACSGKFTAHGNGIPIMKTLASDLWYEDSGSKLILKFSLHNRLQEVGLEHIKKRVSSSTILIIDDQEFNQLLLGDLLKRHDFSNLTFASNGQEGLDMTIKLNPNIVILDLMMPVMDGFDYCQRIRKVPNFSHLPILVQTGMESIENRNKIFECGASDLVTKPVNPDEFIARVNIHLEHQLLMDDLKQYQKRIVKELDEARIMQDMLMPSPSTLSHKQRHYKFRVAHHFETSSEIGGDFWGVRRINDNIMAIYMCDFSGHGVTGALNTFRLHTLMHELMPTYGDNPGNYLEILNSRLFELINRSQFTTIFYGIIDTNDETLSYATAACPTPILWHADKQRCSQLDGSGFPLGAVEQSKYETKTTAFKKDDLLLLYSDSLIETENDAGEFISEEDLVNILEATARSHPEKHRVFVERIVLNEVMKYFHTHSKAPLKDDLTVNVYVRY